MKKIIGLLIILLLLPAAAWAYETFRCNNRVIQTGDLKSKVLECCGEPDSKEDVGEKTYWEANQKIKVPVSEWIYVKYQYDIVITFEASRVVKIENIYK